MGQLGYVLKRLRRMDMGKMVKTARQLSGETGKSMLWLMLDMGDCARRYGAGYVDYRIAQLYRLTPAQRATQITRGKSNAIVARMNDKAYWHHFDDKAQFNALFKDQVNRAWLKLDEAPPEAVANFVRAQGSVIVKPLDGSSGQGIFKLTYDPSETPEALYQRLVDKGAGILEEIVVQHPDLAALCPTSVNTIRIATLLGDKRQGVVYAYLRMGNGNVMDNVDCGGMAAPVDIETGILSGVGADKQGHAFEFHPMTGKRIPGTPIPYWREAVDMCLKAMQVVPQVRFVAWDVAITPTGPVFIEGNSFPSHAIPQFAAHFPEGIGIMPRFEAFIDLH